MNKYNHNHYSSLSPTGVVFAPVPLVLGPLTKSLNCRMVKAVVKANFFTLTIRALISLAWSRWSRWSRQIQHIARARARACVFSLLLLTIIFKLIRIALTTLTTPMMERFSVLTIALTKIDHLDQRGF
jgi:uncharacterized protein YacL